MCHGIVLISVHVMRNAIKYNTDIMQMQIQDLGKILWFIIGALEGGGGPVVPSQI